MILIADSSALITLAIIDQSDILVSLFGEVYVPRARITLISIDIFYFKKQIPISRGDESLLYSI